jgi:hypothetical protein
MSYAYSILKSKLLLGLLLGSSLGFLVGSYLASMMTHSTYLAPLGTLRGAGLGLLVGLIVDFWLSYCLRHFPNTKSPPKS